MRLLYPCHGLLAGALLALSLPTPARAQAPAAARPAAPAAEAATPPRWLFKGGLSVTHLRYDRTATTWQLLVPTALGLERRLSARTSLYAQLDTDWQLGSAARGRRPGSPMTTALPAATVGLGGRLYYAQPAGPLAAQPGRPELGRYLALEANATFERTASVARRAVTQRSVLTPALYVLWGVQHRLRPHLLYDLNGGLGVLAPARTSGEPPLTRHGWDVGAQANLRLYWVH